MFRRRTLSTTLVGAVAAGLVAVVIAGCGGGGGGGGANAAAAPPTTSGGHAATVGLENTGLGKVLANSGGRTLYLFRADHGTMSACTGACVTDWPPLRAASAPKIGAGLQASAVTTAKRADGNPQVTYHGHPLYTYIGDQKAGDTHGQGINEFGASWYAVTASGSQASGSSSGSTGGY